VHPNAGVSAAPPGFRVDIRRFPWINRIALDIAFDAGRLSAFLSGDWRQPNAWREAITRAQAHERNREELVALLHAQQAGRGAPEATSAAAGRLRDSRAVAVVTGQQAGLFGGPLYTVLKALTAIRLADEVGQKHGVPAIPVFWVDAEDHDWAEVNHCGVLDAEGLCHSIVIDDEPPPSGQPVARVRLGASIDRAIDALAAALPATEFTADLLGSLRAAYQPGRGMADAFARWLETLLGPRGLVVYDASDPAAKPLASGVFAREIETAPETSRRAAEAGHALESQGYHAQVSPQLDAAALFWIRDGRVPIRVADGGLAIGDTVETRAALAERARRQPQEFGPNVLLRPVVQDAIFPTVCYVGGPSEAAYLAQLRGVYESFGIPMPLVYPRASATVVDSNAGRFIGRGDLPFEALQARDEAALNALLGAALPREVDGAMGEVQQALEQRMEVLARAVTAVDPTLEGAARSTLGRMQDDVRKLQGKILQAAKRKDETLRRQFMNAQSQAFPGGVPQERVVGLVSFLNKYGPAVVDRLAEGISLEPGVHTVLTP
jgi:bacillithiol biosynthesis cysteine-adding enzyme BshC